ncbi:MAG: FliH/SctL family protein [Myxococcales bacterium]
MTLFDRKPSSGSGGVVLAKFTERHSGRVSRTSWLPQPLSKRRPPSIPPPAMTRSVPPPPPVEVVELSAEFLEAEMNVEAFAEPSMGTAPGSVVHFAPPPVRDDRLELTLLELQGSLEQLVSLRSELLLQTEQELVELAAAIAKRVVGAELALDPTLLARVAREGIDALAGYDRVTVRIGSGVDEASLETIRARLRGRGARCDVVADPDLGPGQCIVETDYGRVDESLDRRLGMVLDALVPQGEAPASH